MHLHEETQVEADSTGEEAAQEVSREVASQEADAEVDNSLAGRSSRGLPDPGGDKTERYKVASQHSTINS